MKWGIWQIFTRAIGTLTASFCLELKMYELEIYRRIMCHDNEEWCENWRGIDLSVPCGHKQFEKFWPEHLKISKICTLVGSFWSKYKMFQLKKYRAVIFDGTQDWYQVWRKTDLCFRKLTWGIWWIFTRELESLQIGTLTASFCLKLKMYELEIYRRIMWTRAIWKILTRALKNLKNLHFSGLILIKV